MSLLSVDVNTLIGRQHAHHTVSKSCFFCAVERKQDACWVPWQQQSHCNTSLRLLEPNHKTLPLFFYDLASINVFLRKCKFSLGPKHHSFLSLSLLWVMSPCCIICLAITSIFVPVLNHSPHSLFQSLPFNLSVSHSLFSAIHLSLFISLYLLSFLPWLFFLKLKGVLWWCSLSLSVAQLNSFDIFAIKTN